MSTFSKEEHCKDGNEDGQDRRQGCSSVPVFACISETESNFCFRSNDTLGISAEDVAGNAVASKSEVVVIVGEEPESVGTLGWQFA